MAVTDLHIVRAFNAINYAKPSADAHRQGELVGSPATTRTRLIIASRLIQEIGFEPG
jgi:hypothetical protein